VHISASELLAVTIFGIFSLMAVPQNDKLRQGSVNCLSKIVQLNGESEIELNIIQV
jgi:hypothetical protein